jgi:hypothetical protein
MLPYLIAGAIGFGIAKIFEEGGETFGRGGKAEKKYYWIKMDRSKIDEYIDYASRMMGMFEGEIYTQAPNKVAFDTENDMFAFTSMIDNHNNDNDFQEGDEGYIHYEELFNGEPRPNIFDRIIGGKYAGGGSPNWKSLGYTFKTEKEAHDFVENMPKEEFDKLGELTLVFNGEEFILAEVTKKKNTKSGKKNTIKDWYIKNYPTDDLGEELNEITFEELWNEDYKKYNIYQVMGVADSVIRERLFEHLAEIKGVTYGEVYRKLFSSEGFYAGGGGVGADSKTKIQITDSEEGGKIATRTLVKKNQKGESITYELTVGVFKDRKKGYFEIYATDSEDEEYFYAEGGLWIEGGKVTDYDGVYELSEKLRPLMSALNLNTQDVFSEGGEAKKRRRRANVQTGRTDRSVDKTRVGKPVGYRFSNSLASKLRKDQYAVPTEKQITKYLGKGIYKENRKNRSDKDRTAKL